MALHRSRRPSNQGSNPGLTPIDNIHENSRITDVEPNTATGRLPAQDESDERGMKRRRTKKKGMRNESS